MATGTTRLHGSAVREVGREAVSRARLSRAKRLWLRLRLRLRAVIVTLALSGDATNSHGVLVLIGSRAARAVGLLPPDTEIARASLAEVLVLVGVRLGAANVLVETTGTAVTAGGLLVSVLIDSWHLRAVLIPGINFSFFFLFSNKL